MGVMYLMEPGGMLKLLELALLSASIACISQYHKDTDLSDMSDEDFDRILLFYAVFVTGLVIVFVLFVSFLCDLNSSKRCGLPRGWTAFVMVFSLIWAILCVNASALFSEVVTKLQEDSWDQSNDKRLQWRYQHALAAVFLGFLSFLAFLVDAILHCRITMSTPSDQV